VILFNDDDSVRPESYANNCTHCGIKPHDGEKEVWTSSAYEYRVPPSEVVRPADIPKTKGKGNRVTGKSAKAPRKNGRKAPRDMAGASQA